MNILNRMVNNMIWSKTLEASQKSKHNPKWQLNHVKKTKINLSEPTKSSRLHLKISRLSSLTIDYRVYMKKFIL